MEEIYSLIKSLTKGEWQSFRNYLSCFSSHNPAEIKQLQLAQLLWNSENCPPEKFCCVKIFGIKKSTSFDALKSRLKEKILDFLLTDISCDKQKELDEADYFIIKAKKRSAQFTQLFYSKKRIPLLYELLDEIIHLAKEYEQYSMLVDSLRFKKSIVSSKNKKKDFEKVSEEMDKAMLFGTIYNKAEHYYNELMMIGDLSSKQDKQKATVFLEGLLKEVREGFTLTNSPIVHYYLKNLEMGYFQLQGDHLQARSTCLELLNIVRNNKSVYRRQRVGVVYDNLSRCEFYLGNFKEAAISAREGQKHFNEGSENFCIALEQEFYALFAMQQYAESIAIAKKMMASATRKELGEFRFSKYNYLLANALFKLGKYKDAYQLLSQERGLSKDKAGWETGARILSIMTLIEMLKLNEASSAIGSLRKFIDYTQKTTPVSERDKTILALLIGAERKGFMFSLLNGKTQDHMSSLSSSDENTRWEPFTHELIPFHEWFGGKLKTSLPVQAKGSASKNPAKVKEGPLHH